MIFLTFCGGAQEVTGSNYLLETGTKKILVDCGMFHGCNFCDARNYADFPYNPREIDAVLITHAHMDHIGKLPKLFRDGFRGKIFATPPTRDLAKIMLSDSADLIAREARRAKRRPLYRKGDAARVLELFHGTGYKREVDLGGGVSFQFLDAGHILGSAIIRCVAGRRTVIFSGDLGNPPTPLLCRTERVEKADYLLVESTYGDRLHESAGERKSKLEDVIENTIARGGTLMIPAFALERTQEILFELNELVEHRRIPRIPVFIDSPLAIEATNLYHVYANYFNKEAQYIINSGDDLFRFPGIHFTKSRKDSEKIAHVPPPKLIIAGSGMSTGGRIVRHEKRYLPDSKNTLLIIGYQGGGSLGRRILEGKEEVRIGRARIPVRARIEAIGGYSAHADQKGLLEWINPMRLSLLGVFAVQGELRAAAALARKIRDELAVPARVPKHDERIRLS